MLLGTLNSSRAFPGAPLGALGHLSGGLGGHGGPIVDVWELPERVQSHFKIIEKPLLLKHFGALRSCGISLGGPVQPLGVLERSASALTSLKGRTSADIFVFLEKHEKGQRPLTFMGWGVNGG